MPSSHAQSLGCSTDMGCHQFVARSSAEALEISRNKSDKSATSAAILRRISIDLCCSGPCRALQRLWDALVATRPRACSRFFLLQDLEMVQVTPMTVATVGEKGMQVAACTTLILSRHHLQPGFVAKLCSFNFISRPVAAGLKTGLCQTVEVHLVF